PARVVGGEELAAELPERRVEVVDLDDVARRVVDPDAVADPVGRASEDVDPSEKARHRSLHGQTDDDRDDSERDQARLEIPEERRARPANEEDAGQESDDSGQVVPGGRTLDSGNPEDLRHALGQQEPCDDRRGERNPVAEVVAPAGQRDDLRLDEEPEADEDEEERREDSEPDAPGLAGRGLRRRFRRRGLRERFLDLVLFLPLFRGPVGLLHVSPGVEDAIPVRRKRTVQAVPRNPRRAATTNVQAGRSVHNAPPIAAAPATAKPRIVEESPTVRPRAEGSARSTIRALRAGSPISRSPPTT